MRMTKTMKESTRKIYKQKIIKKLWRRLKERLNDKYSLVGHYFFIKKKEKNILLWLLDY